MFRLQNFLDRFSDFASECERISARRRFVKTESRRCLSVQIVEIIKLQNQFIFRFELADCLFQRDRNIFLGLFSSQIFFRIVRMRNDFRSRFFPKNRSPDFQILALLRFARTRFFPKLVNRDLETYGAKPARRDFRVPKNTKASSSHVHPRPFSNQKAPPKSNSQNLPCLPHSWQIFALPI